MWLFLFAVYVMSKVLITEFFCGKIPYWTLLGRWSLFCILACLEGFAYFKSFNLYGGKGGGGRGGGGRNSLHKIMFFFHVYVH